MAGYRTTVRKPCSHGLHLFLTLITFGLWAPVWIVMAVVGRRETVVTQYPVQGGPGWSQQTGYVTPETGYYNPYSGRWTPR
jgi:hypothetical protein